MYAIAIFDSVTKKLTLVRDPSGIKPLFWSESKSGLFFGSTVSALSIFLEPEDLRMNKIGLASGLKFGGPLGNLSCFENIKKLPTGMVHEISAREKSGLNIQTLPLSSLKEANVVFSSGIGRENTNAAANVSRPEVTRLIDLLDEVLVDQLYGVGNPGVFLSGGLDSTLIASRLVQMDHRTPTYYFCDVEGTSGSLPVAKEVADYLGLQLEVVSFSARDLVLESEALLKQSDFPIIDLATFALSKLSREARKKSQVLFVRRRR